MRAPRSSSSVRRIERWQRGEQVERAGIAGFAHLAPVLLREGRPVRRALGVLGALAELHRLDARREVREPDVVPVLARERRLRHAARRPPHGADAQALVGRARAA